MLKLLVRGRAASSVGGAVYTAVRARQAAKSGRLTNNARQPMEQTLRDSMTMPSDACARQQIRQARKPTCAHFPCLTRRAAPSALHDEMNAHDPGWAPTTKHDERGEEARRDIAVSGRPCMHRALVAAANDADEP